MKRNLFPHTLIAATFFATSFITLPVLADPGHGDNANHKSSKVMKRDNTSASNMAGSKDIKMHGSNSHRGMMKRQYHGTHTQIMMGRGMHSSMMWNTMPLIRMTHGSSVADKNFTAEDVTKILAGRLAWNGNKRLKVGNVTEKSENIYVAEIVTVDNSLVELLEVGRKTGVIRRSR